MKIELSAGQIVTKQTDNRGRLYLGPEYADAEVEIAVLDHYEGATESEDDDDDE